MEITRHKNAPILKKNLIRYNLYKNIIKNPEIGIIKYLNKYN